MARLVSPALALLLLLTTAAHAGVRKLDLKDLSDGATRIVVGQVTQTLAEWDGNLIVTRVTVLPGENLKGSGDGAFVVTIPGGTIGDLTLSSGEAPSFVEGEQVVLFIRTGSGCPCDVYGWFQGKYTVVDGMVRELKDTTLASFRADIIAALQAPKKTK